MFTSLTMGANSINFFVDIKIGEKARVFVIGCINQLK
jgi:hypothetical protein